MSTPSAQPATRSQDAAVIGLVALAHGLSHFFQFATAPLFPLMKEEFGISYVALGLVVAVYFATSALLQPIAGIVVDRYGGRTGLICGMALVSLGTLVTALAGSYGMLMAGAVLAGLGNSVFHPADFFILNHRVSESRLGHAFSIHGVAGSLGFAAAPLFIGTLGGFSGWRSALMAASVAGFAMLAILVANAGRLQGARAAGKQDRKALDLKVLFAAPVVLCFLYFCIYAAGWAGIQSFSVSALALQFGVGTTFAAVALTCYMVGSAAGMLAGGFIAVRTTRHAGVAACGLAGSAATMLLVAIGAVPAAAIPVAFAFAGFSAGCTAPSRDLIIRASTPAGATGRVYGFVYSGLDVGSLATPVFYGWLMDHRLPHGVFFAISAFTGLAMLTVLNLPGKTRRAAA